MKFKVGDKVKILTIPRRGEVGTIVRFDTHDSTYCVQLESPVEGEAHWWYLQEHLELVEEPETYNSILKRYGILK